MRIAVITGASSGLGREFAKQLDSQNQPGLYDELWLIARRKELLSELSNSLHTPTRCLSLDLSCEEGWSLYQAELDKCKAQVEVLVNSAGFGVVGGFTSLDFREIKKQIELNCTGLAAVTYQSIPWMEKGSRIIQIASVAAFLPQPFFSIYAATKSFVLSFSRALSVELKPKGITVTTVLPNPMETEFFQKAGSEKAVRGIKRIGLEEPARVVQKALRRSQKNRTMSLTHPTAWAVRLASRLLPHALILYLESFMGIWPKEKP